MILKFCFVVFPGEYEQISYSIYTKINLLFAETFSISACSIILVFEKLKVVESLLLIWLSTSCLVIKV